MSDDVTLLDLAQQVLTWAPNGTKQEWGAELLRLVHAHQSESLDREVENKLIAALGTYASGLKASRERSEQAQRMLDRGIAYNGRLVTPTIAVRGDIGSQQVLWTEATPRQFIDAVLREQKVIDGRNDSNRMRRQLVELLLQDERLLDLDSLGAVCTELGIDPDTLALEELPA